MTEMLFRHCKLVYSLSGEIQPGLHAGDAKRRKKLLNQKRQARPEVGELDGEFIRNV